MRPGDPARNLKVVCRIRPSEDDTICVMQDEEDAAVFTSPVTITRTEGLPKYAFDQVISESSRQGDVFRALVETYVKDLMTGRSACVLLFGPTGSGKSYTVRGGEGQERGLLLRIVETFLGLSMRQRAAHTLSGKAVLVFEDRVVDLSPTDSTIMRVNDIVMLLQRALRARKTFCAGQKDVKDQAHFIVSLSVLREGVQLSRLDVVELAGSEHATDISVARAFNAISAFLAGSGGRRHCLCEQLVNSMDIYGRLNPSQVLFVCTVSPEVCHYKHSLAAVKFASKIRDVVRQSGEEAVAGRIRELEQEIAAAECPSSQQEASRFLCSCDEQLTSLESQASSDSSSAALLQACTRLRKKLDSLRTSWLSNVLNRKRSGSSSPLPNTERLASGQSQNSSLKESPGSPQTNSRLVKRVESLLQDVERLEETNRLLELDKARLEARLRLMEKNKESPNGRKAEVAEAKSEIVRLQTQLSEAEQRVTQLSDDVECRRQEVTELKKANEELQQRCDSAEQENSQLEHLFDQLYHEKLELERNLHQAKQVTKSDSKLLQERIADLQEDLQEVKAQLQEVLDSEAALTEEKRELESELQCEREKVEKEVSALKQELEDQRKATVEAESRFRVNTEESANAGFSELKEIIESRIVERLVKIERKIEEGISESQSAELTTTISELRQENTHLQSQCDSLTSDLRTEKLKAQKELKRIRDDLHACEDTVKTLQNEHKETLASTENAAQEEKAALQRELDAARSEVQAASEVKAKLESLTMELTKARLEVMHFQIENNQLTARLDKVTPEVDLKLKDVSSRISHLQTLLEVAKTPLESIPPSQSLLSGDEDDLEEELIVEVDDQSPLEEQRDATFRSSYG